MYYNSRCLDHCSSTAVCVHVNNKMWDRDSNYFESNPGRLCLLPISSMLTSCVRSARHVSPTSSNSFINIISNCPVQRKSIDADWRQHAGSNTVQRSWIILPKFTPSHNTEAAEYRCSWNVKLCRPNCCSLEVSSPLTAFQGDQKYYIQLCTTQWTTSSTSTPAANLTLPSHFNHCEMNTTCHSRGH